MLKIQGSKKEFKESHKMVKVRKYHPEDYEEDESIETLDKKIVN